MTCRDEIYSQLSQLAIAKFADIVNGTKIVDGNIIESNLSNNPKDAIRDLLIFARSIIKE